MADTVREQHSIIGNVETTKETFRRNSHPDAQWFHSAGMGLFIHWGLSCVCAQCDLSWGMMLPPPHYNESNMKVWGLPSVATRLPPRQYWKMAEDFQAENYDPGKWLKSAAEAGFRYAILTTRHHEGFALWPSSFGEFNTKNYLNGRDLVGEFVSACRENGLKTGFYYSPPDWYFDREFMTYGKNAEGETVGIDFEPREKKVPTPEHKELLKAYRRGQIEELLTRYGKIDILWFDGSCENAISFDEIRALQPAILCNNRGHGYGDFRCPECKFPESRIFQKGEWFEYIHSLSDGGWGYNDYETYRPAGWFLEEMAKARSWGGNWTANVGPKADGSMPNIFYKRMEQIKAWMNENSEAMFGTEPGPWPERCNVPVTCRGNIWYLHAVWTCDYPIELKGVARPVSVTLKGEDIPWKYENRVLTFSIPYGRKTVLTDIVKVCWNEIQENGYESF